MLMGTCSGSTWRRAGAGSRAGPFLEAVCITTEASFDSCATNKHANKHTNPSDITRAEKYNYRAQVSSINLTPVLWRAPKPAAAQLCIHLQVSLNLPSAAEVFTQCNSAPRWRELSGPSDA